MTGKKKTAALERGGQLDSKVQSAAETYKDKSHTRLAVVLAEKTAIAAIEYATAKYPCLSRAGMVTYLLQPYEEFSICGVLTALAYLLRFPKQSTPQYSSDWLSDKAEEWGGDCAVANGELCVAAVYLRLPIESNDGPNAIIGVNVPVLSTTGACDPRTLN